MVLKLGANQAHAADIEAAAARAGLDPAGLAALLAAEAATRNGRWDPQARNGRTSAAGLAQFLKATWVELATRPGTWLHAEALARGLVTAAGRVLDEEQLLAMRLEPTAAIMSAADYARANLATLERAGIVPAGADEAARLVYLAHHEGAAGAVAVCQNRLDEQRAERLLKVNVGTAKAGRLRAASASWSVAYVTWLKGYIEARIVPARFRI